MEGEPTVAMSSATLLSLSISEIYVRSTATPTTPLVIKEIQGLFLISNDIKQEEPEITPIPFNIRIFPEPRPELLKREETALNIIIIQYGTSVKKIKKSISNKYTRDIEKWENKRLE